jgi:hypothetical protein
MQDPEEFMRLFFHARTEQIQQELESRKSFRNMFYADECYWDSRKGGKERSEREKIVRVSRSENDTYVVTEGTDPWPQLRYHLRQVNDSWLIHSVDGQCFSCRGESGAFDCVCKGRGWLRQEEGGVEETRRWIESAKRNIPPFRRFRPGNQ